MLIASFIQCSKQFTPLVLIAKNIILYLNLSLYLKYLHASEITSLEAINSVPIRKLNNLNSKVLY